MPLIFFVADPGEKSEQTFKINFVTLTLKQVSIKRFLKRNLADVGMAH